MKETCGHRAGVVGNAGKLGTGGSAEWESRGLEEKTGGDDGEGWNGVSWSGWLRRSGAREESSIPACHRLWPCRESTAADDDGDE